MRASKYVMVTTFEIKPENLNNVTNSWENEFGSQQSKVLYIGKERKELLLIDDAGDCNNIKDIISSFESSNTFSEIKQYMKTDWRRELLEFKESVVEQQTTLPSCDKLQLRHIEVPLSVYDDYLEWRSNTIFNYVKKQDQIESFTAYHSILSAKPGVMFLSCYSGNDDEYINLFKTEKYKDIVRQAGDRFISGGEDGLSTKLYYRAV